MPKNKDGHPQYVIDCEALVAISQTQNHTLRAAALALFSSGKILVPTAVWKELKGGFSDEAEDLGQFIPVQVRVRMMPAHQIIAGNLASRINSGFRVDPYGGSDLLALSVAVAEGCALLTIEGRKKYYEKIGGAEILVISEIFAGVL